MNLVFPFDVEKFFNDCVKQKNFPKNNFQKQVILLTIVRDFKDKKTYSEEQVNEIIKKYFEDYVLIRRELINFGYMMRNPENSNYWVVRNTFTKEDIKNNSFIKKDAKKFNL